MKLLGLYGLFSVLIVTYPFCAIGKESLFTQQILSRKKIANPVNPFVSIFMDGGCDKCPYGFVTDGAMKVDDWKGIFDHVGHLTAYGVFKPGDSRRWSADGRDLAIRAAQSLGRFTGGSVMGVPRTNSARKNVNKAYRDELGLRMTHFFHDDEQSPGTPGGNGDWRIKLAAKQKGILETLPSEDFDITKGENQESFQITFGLFIGEYIFGGNAKLMGVYQSSFLSRYKSGWSIDLVNTGGYNGQNHIVFSTSEGEKVSSAPFNAHIGKAWLPITISIFNNIKEERETEIRIEISGVGITTGQIKRITNAGAGFMVGDPSGLSREIQLDDIWITRLSGKDEMVLAAYNFEEPSTDSSMGKLGVSRALDYSGRRHHLSAKTDHVAAIQYVPTSGIEPEMAKHLATHLIEDLLLSKSSHNLSAPLLITNWRLGDVPGRFRAWKSLGFTHTSTAYYLYDKPTQQISRLAHILLNRVPMGLRAQTDATTWGHAWLGNVNPDKAALTPDEFGSLVVMTVLEGYRWFSVFTAMSKGHLAPAHFGYPEKATTNAAAIYTMAQAASWFQATSKTLAKSVYSEPLGLDMPPNSIFRSRINSSTKEMWFAACKRLALKKMPQQVLAVPVPQLQGTVTDLATGEVTKVSNGVFKLFLGNPVHPFYFRPQSQLIDSK